MQQSTFKPLPNMENETYMKGFLLAFSHQLKIE